MFEYNDIRKSRELQEKKKGRQDMKKTILGTDKIMKVGNEVFAGGMKKVVRDNITKDNVVLITLVLTMGTVFIVHDLITNGYEADVGIESKRFTISLKQGRYYSQVV